MNCPTKDIRYCSYFVADGVHGSDMQVMQLGPVSRPRQVTEQQRTETISSVSHRLKSGPCLMDLL